MIDPADYCDEHACPLPCEICKEVAEATRTFDDFDRRSHELRNLYSNANQRRSRALRMLGAVSLEVRPDISDPQVVRIALALEADLNDRRGLHLSGLDAHVRREIRQRWKQIIREAFDA